MVFAEFQEWSLGLGGKPKEIVSLCGSSGYYILDGRNRLETWIADARARAKELDRVYGDRIIGFKLFRGRSLSDCYPIEGGKVFPIK